MRQDPDTAALIDRLGLRPAADAFDALHPATPYRVRLIAKFPEGIEAEAFFGALDGVPVIGLPADRALGDKLHELFVHELAHVAVGIGGQHDAEWAAAEQRLHAEISARAFSALLAR